MPSLTLILHTDSGTNTAHRLEPFMQMQKLVGKKGDYNDLSEVSLVVQKIVRP